jgi:predicted Zn-dependent protease
MMTPRTYIVIRALALIGLLLAPVLGACSAIPATGERSFTGFMGPADEARVGREQHPEIVRAFGGAYADRRVQDYVTRVGQSIARVTETPELRFTFTVLDSPVVNAFALPGGYVYVTRGLMAIASDEAELAGVIAHEIGHVTARHAARRYSQQVVAGVGTAVVGVITGSDDIAETFSFGASAVLQSYSRDQEFEADTLGVRYLGRAGYAVEAMGTFLAKLDRQSSLEAELAGRPPGEVDGLNIMATHPRTLDRVERASAQSGAGRRERDTYLQIVDGLVFGDDPDHGLVRGQSFIHPRLGIRFDVPRGFRLASGARQVIAQSANGATIVFDSSRSEPIAMTEYLRTVWGRSLTLAEIERLQVDGFDAATASTRIQTRRGPLDLRLVAVRVDASVHRFLYLTPPALTPILAADLRRTTLSFRRLTPAETTAARPQRIRLHTVTTGETRAHLIELMAPDAGRDRRFDIMNGLAPGATPAAGTVVKVVAE